MNIEQVINPITGNSLSEAWIRALDACLQASGGILAPAIVSFSGGDDKDVHEALLPHFRRMGIRTINQSPMETVAGTIFPESIWKLCNGDRDELYNKYTQMWPIIKRCALNRYGTYFQRLIAYPQDGVMVNQLDKIIEAWNAKNRRVSAFQAAVFSPKTDHRPTSRYMGFPCLQHVIFRPNGPHGCDGLSVIAVYANQNLIDKAYGNYLGLYRLGLFIAAEFGIRLRDVTCFSAQLKLSDKHTKTICKPIHAELERLHQEVSSED